MPHKLPDTNVVQLFIEMPMRQELHVMVDDLSRALAMNDLDKTSALLASMATVIRKNVTETFPQNVTDDGA